MRRILRQIYGRMFSRETRYWFYKLRHPGEMKALITKCNPDGKAVFSLRGVVEKQAIFVHVTKSAGTSVAQSLFGYLPYHYTGWQYRVIFGRRDFSRYFKFAFVRNPWDRLYSAFSYLKGGGWNRDDQQWARENLGGIDDFNEFVLEWLTPERLRSHIHFWPQSWFVFDEKGRLLLDYLGYFETLNEDFSQVAARVNPAAKLLRTNGSRRGNYMDVYSDGAIAKVARLYAEDIRRFGYHFGGLARKCVLNGVLVDVQAGSAPALDAVLPGADVPVDSAAGGL